MSTNRFIVRNLAYRKDCGILFDPRSNTVFKLDEIALEIVNGMTVGESVDEVASKMSKKYDIDFLLIKQDIEDFWESVTDVDSCSSNFEQEKGIQNTPKFPFNLEIALTKACNLQCVFCHDSVLSEKGSRAHLPFETIKSLLSEYANAGLLRVRYSGGEPTLHPNFSEILTYGRDLGLYQVVFTNGQHITEQALIFWKEMNVGEVLVSLHGLEKTHDKLTGKKGSYEKAIRAMGTMLLVDIDLVVEMTLTQQNIKEVFETIDTIKALGVKEFRLMRYVSRGKDDDIYSVSFLEMSSLIDKIEQCYGGESISIRFPCSQRFCLSEDYDLVNADSNMEIRSKYLTQNCFAGLNWGSISHDGKLRLCPHSKKSLADVSECPQTLIEMWPTLVGNQVKKVLKQRSKKCGTCTAWSYCLGGCYLSCLDTTRFN